MVAIVLTYFLGFQLAKIRTEVVVYEGQHLYSYTQVLLRIIPDIHILWMGGKMMYWSGDTFINTSSWTQNGCHLADNIFKIIFLNEKKTHCVLIEMSLKYVTKGAINNKPALVQMMAWHRTGDKPLSEPMTADVYWCIYVIWLQWDNVLWALCLNLWWNLIGFNSLRPSDAPIN